MGLQEESLKVMDVELDGKIMQKKENIETANDFQLKFMLRAFFNFISIYVMKAYFQCFTN
jgi:hypothetical protein